MVHRNSSNTGREGACQGYEQCRTDLPVFMHCLTNYFKKKQPSWNNYLFLRGGTFSPFPFSPRPPSPLLPPLGFFSPPLLGLAFETGSRYLTPLESVVWQTGIEFGSKRALHRACCENTWVSLMPLRTSPASVEITAALPSPSPCSPFKIIIKKNEKKIKMLALVL